MGQIYYFSENMKKFFYKKKPPHGVALKIFFNYLFRKLVILFRKLHDVQVDER